MIGDWGDSFYWETPSPQKAVAAAMNDWAATHQPRFILTTGDNFYPDGVRVSGVSECCCDVGGILLIRHHSSLCDIPVIDLVLLLYFTGFDSLCLCIPRKKYLCDVMCVYSQLMTRGLSRNGARCTRVSTSATCSGESVLVTMTTIRLTTDQDRTTEAMRCTRCVRDDCVITSSKCD